jgi:hypothetical protein
MMFRLLQTVSLTSYSNKLLVMTFGVNRHLSDNEHWLSTAMSMSNKPFEPSAHSVLLGSCSSMYYGHQLRRSSISGTEAPTATTDIPSKTQMGHVTASEFMDTFFSFSWLAE